MKPNDILIAVLFLIAATAGAMAIWPPELHARYAFVAVMALLSAILFRLYK